MSRENDVKNGRVVSGVKYCACNAFELDMVFNAFPAISKTRGEEYVPATEIQALDNDVTKSLIPFKSVLVSESRTDTLSFVAKDPPVN